MVVRQAVAAPCLESHLGDEMPPPSRRRLGDSDEARWPGTPPTGASTPGGLSSRIGRPSEREPGQGRMCRATVTSLFGSRDWGWIGSLPDKSLIRGRTAADSARRLTDSGKWQLGPLGNDG